MKIPQSHRRDLLLRHSKLDLRAGNCQQVERAAKRTKLKPDLSIIFFSDLAMCLYQCATSPKAATTIFVRLDQRDVCKNS
jgi:hypothetical protein